jgi:hypothetical protein
MLNGSTTSVDFALSFFSWEHNGLGRYGDPVDPWGDIKAVQKASCYVKPGEPSPCLAKLTNKQPEKPKKDVSAVEIAS